MKRDLTSFALWTHHELSDMLDRAHRTKHAAFDQFLPMKHKSAALIFEEESLRTRVSFEVCIAQLGGHPIFLQQETIGLATRESVHDIAAVLSQYTDLIIARTTKHQTLVQLAESATVPVINAMTDLVHPCQVLADVFTLQEMNGFSASTKIVFVGSGNNVVNSWLELAEKFPVHFVLSCPPGYEPHQQILEQAKASGLSTIEIVTDPMQAVKEANVVYTDVWPAMEDQAMRLKVFKPYQVNSRLLEQGRPDCVVMHRLPANRGEEITRDVLDGKQSIVLQQAQNRLHAQKGMVGYILEWHSSKNE